MFPNQTRIIKQSIDYETRIYKSEIDTDKGITDGFININKITAFRESTYDCNRTIVFAGNNSFVVYMSFKELCKIMGLNKQ